jgi:hypothetical protein
MHALPFTNLKCPSVQALHHSAACEDATRSLTLWLPCSGSSPQSRCNRTGRSVCIKTYRLSSIGELQTYQAFREARIHMAAYEVAHAYAALGRASLHVVPLYAVFTVSVCVCAYDPLVFLSSVCDAGQLPYVSLAATSP